MADDKIVRIKLDGSGARLEAGRTNAAVKGVGTSADGATRSMFNLKSAAVAVIAALSAGKITQYADSWTSVNNQIKQATSTTREALAVQEAIFQIAKDSRVEINGVASAYQRISNSVKDFGFSASDSLQVVEGLTKAFKANGASAQEVSSVLTQLGQGLGSGALQGEELRAVLEASLPVSRAIANEFGVQVGQLKALGAEGKLTTERVFTAIQNSLPAFETAFEKANKTIAEGFTVTNSSVTRLIGLTSEATGAGDTLANGLIDLASAVEQLGDAVESGAAGKIAEVFKAQLNLIVSDVTTTVNYIFDSWDDTSKAVQASSTKTGEFIGDAFLNIIPNIRTMIQVLTVELASGIDKLAAYGKAVEQTLNPFDDVSANQARGFFGRQVKQIDEVREASIQSIFDQREVEKAAQNERIAEAEALIAKYKEQRAARSADLSSGVLGGGPSPEQRTNNDLDSFFSQDGIFSGGSGGESDEPENTGLTEKLQRENQMIQDSLFARQGIYAQYYQTANDVYGDQYERQRAQLELNLAEEMIREEENFQQKLQRITDRNLAIQENESINQVEKDESAALLRDQEILLEQEFEARKTQIAQQGNAQRQELELASLNSRVSAWSGFASSTLGLMSAFGIKSNKLQKGFAIADGVVNIAAGVTKALNNPYPANLGFAAQVAAQGAGLLATIKGASSSSKAPTLSASKGSTSSFTPSAASTASTQTNNTRRIVDLRGFDNGGYLTKEQLTELLAGDEDVIIASNNGQKQGARIGAINNG